MINSASVNFSVKILPINNIHICLTTDAVRILRFYGTTISISVLFLAIHACIGSLIIHVNIKFFNDFFYHCLLILCF